MRDTDWLDMQGRKTKSRLLPRLEMKFADDINNDPTAWEALQSRLEQHFDRLFSLYYSLYSGHYDFFYHLEELLNLTVRHWFDRPDELKDLDIQREKNPEWYLSNQMLGGVCYVDLFAEDFAGLRKRIPYLKELGLTYLHLMPLFLSPEGENDGGYAISSYRETNPILGSMKDLVNLARDLRREGICLAVDFVFNHTSDEHIWAQQALQGDPEHQEYYRMFSNRQIPDQYEAHLREIFPEDHPGAFTYREELGKWVWTTFNTFQWDLNYANPAVFNRMADEMLHLANIGVDVLRLDAVAFIWKKLGTDCENLNEAHSIIRAFNAICRIAAPGMLFKSEAIVHPDEVVKYIDMEECQLSYNPLLMALLWNTLATREVNLLEQALRGRFDIPTGCSWVNYVRVHDDIGWTFSDEDAARLDINGYDHRKFLNNFYTGRFPGSFAQGLPFQENLRTGDMRISGTTASLAGLEKAVLEGTEDEVNLAIRRILLIHAVILTIGGLPLIYLGDEIGTLNDYEFRNDPRKIDDNRWVHRPPMDWKKAELRNENITIEGRIYHGLSRLIALRKNNYVFSGLKMGIMDTGNVHVLGYYRQCETDRVLVFANFSEKEQVLPTNLLRIYGTGHRYKNMLDGEFTEDDDAMRLLPFEFLPLACS